jgi:diguanylate cyclase (GGDEF)-like protein
VFLVIHFNLEAFISFGKIDHVPLISAVSLSIYHLAGALTILFIFIEKLSLDYSPIAPTRLGNQFMWVASIIGIIAIPTGLIIRSLLDAPPLNLLLIGIPSIIVSSVVILRFIVLISHSNQQKKRLKLLIQTDALTELSNYHGYLEKLTLANIKNTLVISLNIEDFKAINDLYGRDMGDNVLKSLAKRLQELPHIFLAIHSHSDLFLIVFQTKESNVQRLLKTVQESLGVWDTVQGNKIAVPLTFGASYCKGIANPEILAKQAEQALKKAREQHTSLSFYSEEVNKKQLPRHELRHILQQSLDSNYLPVHFQPIYNLEDGSLKALELLIRVDSKKHGLLLPGQFLEQAKSYGLLTSLTQVCIQMVAQHYATLPDVVININLPPYMLKSPRLLRNFIHLFEQEELPAEKFCIEITEDGDISVHALVPAIQTLKDYGFSIAMDDFGTGYSSLDRLSILAVDTVKIDRSLLLSASSGNTAILKWAISLAKQLGVSAVVEGVETIEQLSLVKLLGADAVQGFLYSKPVSAKQASHLRLNANDISIA